MERTATIFDPADDTPDEWTATPVAREQQELFDPEHVDALGVPCEIEERELTWN